MVWAGLIAAVAQLAGGWLTNRMEVQKAKAEAEAEQHRSIARLAERRAEAEIQWDVTMADASRTSWKDEWWTLLLSVPLILCFIPGLAPYAKAGFETLNETVPDWYLAALSVAIAAAFGVKALVGALKRK